MQAKRREASEAIQITLIVNLDSRGMATQWDRNERMTMPIRSHI